MHVCPKCLTELIDEEELRSHLVFAHKISSTNFANLNSNVKKSREMMNDFGIRPKGVPRKIWYNNLRTRKRLINIL